MITLQTQSGKVVQIEDTPFNSGGEGRIHKVLNSSVVYQNSCVKLYFDCLNSKNAQKVTDRETKILFMVANKPQKVSDKTWKICWPEEAVYLNGVFAGFIMPLAFDESITLFELTNLKLSRSHGIEWYKFDRNTSDGFRRRLMMVSNVALAIYNVHVTGSYVIVDLKPQNILVSPSGFISVIDADTIQIFHNGKLLFPSKAMTPEYLPPESSNKSTQHIEIHWDNFILGLMFYEVLLGIHPFVGAYKSPYDNYATLQDRIAQGLFPYGAKSKYFAGAPVYHDKFKQLPDEIKDLFIKTFVTGLTQPNLRPSANTWGQTVYLSVKNHNSQSFSTLLNQNIISNPPPTASKQPALQFLKRIKGIKGYKQYIGALIVLLSIILIYTLYDSDKSKADGKLYYVFANQLNLRSSPEIRDDNIKLTLKYGDNFRIISATNGWYEVSLDTEIPELKRYSYEIDLDERYFVYSDYVMSEDDFKIIDAILSNNSAEGFISAEFRRMLVSYFKTQSLLVSHSKEETETKDVSTLNKVKYRFEGNSDVSSPVISKNRYKAFGSDKKLSNSAEYACILTATDNPRKYLFLYFKDDLTDTLSNFNDTSHVSCVIESSNDAFLQFENDDFSKINIVDKSGNLIKFIDIVKQNKPEIIIESEFNNESETAKLHKKIEPGENRNSTKTKKDKGTGSDEYFSRTQIEKQLNSDFEIRDNNLDEFNLFLKKRNKLIKFLNKTLGRKFKQLPVATHSNTMTEYSTTLFLWEPWGKEDQYITVDSCVNYFNRFEYYTAEGAELFFQKYKNLKGKKYSHKNLELNLRYIQPSVAKIFADNQKFVYFESLDMVSDSTYNHLKGIIIRDKYNLQPFRGSDLEKNGETEENIKIIKNLNWGNF